MSANMDDTDLPEWLRFGVAASLSRQYAVDQRQFLELLAQMLERALPGEVTIERRGGLFSRKTIHKVSVPLGDNRYTLEDPGQGNLSASRTHIVRGIALKTEPVAVEVWLQELGAALDERAKTSAAVREGLQRFVG